MGIIERRRSIRMFQNDSISTDKIEAILNAGVRAPSPKNRQPWFFCVSKQNKIRQKIVELMRREILKKIALDPKRQDLIMALESVEFLECAPIVVFVYYLLHTAEAHDDGVRWSANATDLEAVELLSVGAAIENMLLKAVELNLGGVCCCDILYAYNEVVHALPAIKNSVLVSAVCLGVPGEKPNLRPRKEISDSCAFI